LRKAKRHKDKTYILRSPSLQEALVLRECFLNRHDKT
jgi:hypothetical protein